ncbi:hypothetical protein BGX33_002496, partial [Mortierella sp. NVP41]
ASDDEDDNHSDKENSDPNVLNGYGTWLKKNSEYSARAMDIVPGIKNVGVEVVSGQDQDDNSPISVPRHHDDGSTHVKIKKALSSRRHQSN